MTWVLTHQGHRFDLEFPDPATVDIRDIAHALAYQCRFNGHTKRFYSVGQHSVIMAMHAPMEAQRLALLHDAAEAYVGDMVRPLKERIHAFQVFENKVWAAIAARFGLPPGVRTETDRRLYETIKTLDERMLATERRDLLPPHEDWPVGDRCFKAPIVCWPPENAEIMFLSAWRNLEAGFRLDPDVFTSFV